MAKQNLNSICCWALALALALNLASAATEQQAASGCQVGSATSAQEQMISLSKLVDPSGRLSKMITDFNAEPRTIDHPKRSADETAESKANSTTAAAESTTKAAPAPVSSAGPASSSQEATTAATSTTSSTTTTSTTAAPATTAAPSTTAAAIVSTTTPTPMTTPVTSNVTSNVTVNVFLQLVPDAKTDELINNPDSTPAASSPKPEQPSTAASAAPSSAATAEPAAATPMAPSSNPAPSSTTETPMTTEAPKRFSSRRRRSVASSETPAQPRASTTTTMPPSSSSQATATSTPSTTTLAPSSSAPSSTTTTTTTPAPTPAATTQASPAAKSADPMVAKSSSVAPSIVEVSSGNSPAPAAGEPAVLRIIDVPFTIEVVSSSAPASNATAQTDATEQPSTSASTSTASPSTTTSPAPKVASTEAASTAAPSSLPPSTTAATTTTTTSKSSTNSTEGTALAQAIGAAIHQSLNLSVTYNNNNTSSAQFTSPSSADGAEKARSPTSHMGDFVEYDRPEENERENYATCRLEPLTTAGSAEPIEGLIGRINFWQPIDNRGILHMLVRVRYQLTTVNTQQQAQSDNIGKTLTKRESFRAPIELAPANGSEAARWLARRKHVVRLTDGDCGGSGNHLTGGDSIVVGEPTATTTLNSLARNLVDIDAELLVAQFNLTGTNELAKKYLVLSLPSGAPIGCCQVIATEQLVASELDNLPSVQVVQPTREELLPPRLKAEDEHFGYKKGLVA